jgi:hypothetical protein
MKFYIAAKYEDHSRALALMQALERLGHTITFKWPVYQSPTDCQNAANDMRGVMTCDMLVLLFDKPASNSTPNRFVELGLALAMKKEIIIIGTCDTGCIFTKLPIITRYPDIASFIAVPWPKDK